MNYTLTRLRDDILARMGESVAPAGVHLAGVASTAEIVERKAGSLLPEVGRRLLSGASAAMMAGAPGFASSIAARKMPCGLYAADIALPDGFARLVAARMESWSRSVHEMALPGTGGYERQWSDEPGIAGCPSRPRAYLHHTAAGAALRLMGSEAPADTLAHLYLWCEPRPDPDGSFLFPAALYGALVGGIAEAMISVS